jgi:Ni/Fe-hydrogenase subunit HybB-like protein
VDASAQNLSIEYKTVNDDLLRTIAPPTWRWYALFAVALTAVALGGFCWWRQVLLGIGLSGKNNPIGWCMYVTDFVFWVGIAHSGTLISSILYLFRAKWRVPVFRIAEAMTVFAIITAALFPVIHLGRPWYFYWLLPYSNQRYLWVNFKSPLIWDFFAVGTYLVVSVLFFILGLIPDVAAVRDRARGLRHVLYSICALGWHGSSTQWRHYAAAYGIIAALAAPLVVSVHSVVSWDFAVSNVPGWHSTLFPPYFVAGAVFSGLAMVLTISIPLRTAFGLEKYLTVWHYEKLAKLIIFTSGIVTFAYITEFFMAWYGGNPYERYQFYYRVFGDMQVLFWAMVFCNCVAPLSLWFEKLRTNLSWLFVLSLLINLGMWLERFSIIVQSLARDHNPAVWGEFNFSWTELGITVGSFGWFFAWILAFIKFFPSVSLTEVKEVMLGREAEI